MSVRYPHRTNNLSPTHEAEIREWYRKLDLDPIGSSSSAYLRGTIERYLREGFAMGQRWSSDEAFLQEVARLFRNKWQRLQIESSGGGFDFGARVPPPKSLRYRRSHAVQRRFERRRARTMAPLSRDRGARTSNNNLKLKLSAQGKTLASFSAASARSTDQRRARDI